MTEVEQDLVSGRGEGEAKLLVRIYNTLQSFSKCKAGSAGPAVSEHEAAPLAPRHPTEQDSS